MGIRTHSFTRRNNHRSWRKEYGNELNTAHCSLPRTFTQTRNINHSQGNFFRAKQKQHKTPAQYRKEQFELENYCQFYKRTSKGLLVPKIYHSNNWHESSWQNARRNRNHRETFCGKNRRRFPLQTHGQECIPNNEIKQQKTKQNIEKWNEREHTKKLVFSAEHKTGHLNTNARQNKETEINGPEKLVRTSIPDQTKKTSQEHTEGAGKEYMPIQLIQPIRQRRKTENCIKTTNQNNGKKPTLNSSQGLQKPFKRRVQSKLWT